MGLLDQVVKPVADKLEALETAFQDALRSDVPIINEINAHIAARAGKRVRPILLLLSARMAGYRGQGDVTLAAAIEFIHTATLIHDDIIDEAELRRGQQSVNAVWGNNLTVLLGDYLYVTALELALKERRLRILDVLTAATRSLTEGELFELAVAGDLEIDSERYLDIIRRKTASLFEASCQLAAVLTDLDDEKETALTQYGFNVGMAFQLIDDMLDFVSNKKTLGKPVVNDLTAGKVTLPVILLQERASADELGLVKRILSENKASEKEQTELVELLDRHGCLESTARLAAEYGRRALKGLTAFEDSPAKRVLEKVPDLLLSRTT